MSCFLLFFIASIFSILLIFSTTVFCSLLVKLFKKSSFLYVRDVARKTARLHHSLPSGDDLPSANQDGGLFKFFAKFFDPIWYYSVLLRRYVGFDESIVRLKE